MRKMVIFFLFIIGLLSSFALMTSRAYAGKIENRTINDSLVQNLSCAKLTIDSVYQAIRDDAFDQSRNMPIVNWTRKDGVLQIGNCWALSRAQRMMSYLARYNASSNSAIEQRAAIVLDMIRGAGLETKGTEKALQSYQVFEVEESNFKESGKSINWSFWKGIFYGYIQYFGSKSEFKSRKLQYELEAYQSSRFFSAVNAGMMWSDGSRPKVNNLKTIKELTKNLDGKRLTLLNLRVGRTTQHIVMAKSYTVNANGVYVINVYDSNYPWQDAVLYFDSQVAEFTAPRIARRMVWDDANRPLGVFIVDEDDRENYETAMLEYYRSLCR